MPIDASVLPTFFLASFVLLVAPGPDMAFIIATGISQGKVAALWASIGIALAMFAHTILAAAGLATLMATSALAFELVRYCGALYLFYLAYKSIGAKPISSSDKTTYTGSWRNFQAGFFTNLLNPKAIIFAGVFFTPICDKERIFHV